MRCKSKTNRDYKQQRNETISDIHIVYIWGVEIYKNIRIDEREEISRCGVDSGP